MDDLEFSEQQVVEESEDYGRQPLRYENPVVSSRPHQIAPEDLLGNKASGKAVKPASMLRRRTTMALPPRANTVKFDFTEDESVNLEKASQDSSCFDSHDTVPQA